MNYKIIRLKIILFIIKKRIFLVLFNVLYMLSFSLFDYFRNIDSKSLTYLFVIVIFVPFVIILQRLSNFYSRWLSKDFGEPAEPTIKFYNNWSKNLFIYDIQIFFGILSNIILVYYWAFQINQFQKIIPISICALTLPFLFKKSDMTFIDIELNKLINNNVIPIKLIK